MPSNESNEFGVDERHSPLEVLRVFLVLGLTSFGGPIAHLGYYERELVSRRRWLPPDDFAEIVALCQVLPGPTSSQVGLAIGKRRAGIAGSFAAWLGFTAPSAILLFLFALLVDRVDDVSSAGWIHGLKVTAVAIVAQAVWNMWQSLAPDRTRSTFAVISALVLLMAMSAGAQILVLLAGGIAGYILFARTMQSGAPTPRDSGQRYGLAFVSLGLLGAIAIILPLVNRFTDNALIELANMFFRVGAIVFGGAHVVLPLLEADMVPAFLSSDQFLSGYGAAQAVPGPLFTFSAYLGGTAEGAAGSLVSIVAIYVPSFLMVWGMFPFWERIRHRAGLRAALRGVNAAVVGLLAAALYDPIFTSAILNERDAGFALVLFGLLQFWKLPAWAVVAFAVVVGAVLF